MNNSLFSSLVYRIIGKPESWHDEYLDIMHQILDETDSLEDPENFSELKIGDKILSRIYASNETLTAFSTLLDKSRFKMIILDEDLKPLYHNHIAEDLYARATDSDNQNQLNEELKESVRAAVAANEESAEDAMQMIEYHGEQVYLRSISTSTVAPTSFHLLLVLDHASAQNELNPDIIARYEFTAKEQMVLLHLIHGKSIKEIANECFISENTVKSHIKSLFRKTGVNSQSAIVGLILTNEAQILDSYFDPGAILLPPAESELDKKLILSGGEVIYYREYGPQDGRPLLICHNGFGCRLMVPPNCEEICVKANRRVIIPDRPGFGRSPYIENHPQGWNDRFAEFIDLLAIGNFDLLGNVLGSPIALDLAMHADHRIQKLILCSPVLVNEQSDIAYLKGIFSASSRLVKASKKMAREIYELWLKSITLNLGTHYRSMLYKSFTSQERTLFEGNGNIQIMIDGFKEGAGLSLEGISNEMVFCMSPLNHDLSKLKVPVEFWYGDQDGRISLTGVKEIAKRFNQSTIHVREGYSEHIYYALFEEIIA